MLFVLLFQFQSILFSSQNNPKTFKLKDASFQVGSYLRTYSVLFDYGHSTIKNKSFLFLDSVVEFLNKNKQLVIEIGNYNTQEAEIYSRSLTRLRAEAIKKYLIEKKINKNRLIAKGYESTKPIMIEKKDNYKSEKVKQAESVNRRTEFVVLQTNFIEEQKADSIIPQKILGAWQILNLTKNSTSKIVVFKMVAQNQLSLIVDSFFTYSFGNNLSKTAFSGLGYKPNWPPYYCFVKQIDSNTIQIEYSHTGAETTTEIYKRKE